MKYLPYRWAQAGDLLEAEKQSNTAVATSKNKWKVEIPQTWLCKSKDCKNWLIFNNVSIW